jgi:hypothetical protein
MHKVLVEYMVKNFSRFKLIYCSIISKIFEEHVKWLKVDSSLQEGSGKRACEAKFP